MRNAIEDIIAERKRQKRVERFDEAHDDKHERAELAKAAACYALRASGLLSSLAIHYWPWSRDWWKPKSRREDLVRAGALIVAEIERLDRLEGRA